MKTIYMSDLKELSGKQFDTVEELEAAEAKVNEKLAKKHELAEIRKADAEAVKKAITERLEAEAAANKAKKEAYKVYLEALDEAAKSVREKKEAENKALKEFCDKHPEGFHDTITVGDVSYKFDYSTNNVTYTDPFRKLLGFWF